MGFKTNLVSFFRDQTVERERGEEKREEEEEEEKKKRREEEGDKFNKQKGMELTLDMNSSMDHMDFVWNSRKVYEFQT